MREIDDDSWPTPDKVTLAQRNFEQSVSDLSLCAETYAARQEKELQEQIQEASGLSSHTSDLAAREAVTEESLRWNELSEAINQLVDRDRLLRYAPRTQITRMLPQLDVSSKLVVVGSDALTQRVASVVLSDTEVTSFETLEDLNQAVSTQDSATQLSALILWVGDSLDQRLNTGLAASIARGAPVLLVGSGDQSAQVATQLRSDAKELGLSSHFPVFGCDLANAAEALQQLLGEGTVSSDGKLLMTEFPVRPDTMAVCEYAVVGTVEAPTPFANEQARPVAAIAPFINRGNLLVKGPWSQETELLIQSLVEQALTTTGAGQLTVTSIDAELRSPLAVFAAVSEATDDVIRPPLSDPTRVSDALQDAASDIRRVQTVLEGRGVSLAQLRTELNQPVETYQLLVVCDFPRAFSQESVDLLVGIMRRGPQCGLSVLLHHDPNAVESHLALNTRWNEIEESANSIEVAPTPSASWLPPWSLQLSRPPKNLAVRMRHAAEWAKEATAPSIDFLECQPSQELMWDRSDKHLVAAIGREGHRIVTITLGDEVDQRHNILISGAVGQGKSNLIMALVHSLAMRYPPSELEFHLLDFKEGITLEPLANTRAPTQSWLPHAKSLGLNSDREYGASVLSYLVAEFDRRADLIRSSGDNIAKYRAADPSNSLPRIVLVIDEFQVLFEGDDAITRSALADLERLARKGRAYGIHLVLASQTISGITSLLAKQDGIFAQFPIRLALKNSPSESRAVLQQDNVEAARLRYRGQLLVNLDFGAVESNRRSTVALADEPVLRRIRSEMVTSLGQDAPRPVVFDGAITTSIAAELNALKNLQSDGDNSACLALLGKSIDVGTPPLAFEINESPGRHIAIVGSGPVRSNEHTRGMDLADGVLQSASLSLALQGRPEFIVVNLLSPQRNSSANMDDFLGLLGTFCRRSPELIEGPDARNFFAEMHDQVASRSAGATHRLFVVVFGLERLTGLDEIDFDSGRTHSPADGLRRLVSQGPSSGAHLLASWANVRTMRQQLGYQLDGSIEGIVALHVAREEVQDLFGPHFHWTPSDNRGVFYDRVAGKPPRAFVPFRPFLTDEAQTLATVFDRD